MPCCTAARSGSRRTSVPRSTSWQWCSATSAMDSGTGVAFTRDPGSGDTGEYGDYLQNAQGEDVVAGIRNTLPLHDLERARQEVLQGAHGDHAAARGSTTATCATSSSRSSAANCGCCRPASGKRTAGGGVPDRHAARRRGPHQHGRGAAAGDRRAADQLMFPQFDAAATDTTLIARGHERVARGSRRQGGLRLTARWTGRPGARTSSLSGRRPTRTTSTG